MSSAGESRPRFQRFELAGVGLVAAAAVVVYFVAPTYPNYDSYYHLVWGRELFAGHAPSFEAYAAPTEHPLLVLVGGLLSLAGTIGDRGLVAITVASLVATVWATFRLGARIFGPWPGAAAALFVGTSTSLLLYAARGYVDVPFLALVLWAAALEAGAPRRGRGVMALLALAGLLRPEAWPLAAAYWLWCRPAVTGRERGVLLALAAVGPVGWAAVDLAFTGDPLHSLHATSELADELNRRHGLSRLPHDFASFLASTLRAPVAAAGALGLALAVWRRDRLALAVPLALLGAGIITFVGTGVAGLSILPRYLTVPAVALCLFAGYALLGFTELPRGPARRRWARVALVCAVAGVAIVAVRTPSLDRLTGELRFVRTTHSDLVAILHRPAVRDGMRCGPVTFPTYRLVPDSRWILDAPRSGVGARSAKRRDHGVAMFVVGDKPLRRYGFAEGASPSTNAPDPGFERVARAGMFVAYASCPGA
jgi:hypothetical protein